MAKLADAPDLGSGSARSRGSSPLLGTCDLKGNWEEARRCFRQPVSRSGVQVLCGLRLHFHDELLPGLADGLQNCAGAGYVADAASPPSREASERCEPGVRGTGQSAFGVDDLAICKPNLAEEVFLTEFDGAGCAAQAFELDDIDR